MAQRTLYPEYRAEREGTRWPFAASSTLVNSEGRVILEGAILDATLYPVGGLAGLYLTRVVIDHETATFFVGNTGNTALCSGGFALAAPPGSFALVDTLGRPAGLVVSEPDRLASFGAWGVGTHAFTRAQAEFAAGVCVPTPEVGLRGILLDDGTLMTGDVWLIGGPGVVLSSPPADLPAGCGAGARAIRIDVVGDPLFRRRLCEPQSLFDTPRFVTTLRVADANGTVVDLTPDETGAVQLFVNNSDASDTVLRIVTTEDGLRVEAAGTSLAS